MRFKEFLTEKKKWQKVDIEGAADAVVTSRDFVGDEKAAIKQYADDYGLSIKDAPISKIMQMANKTWRGSQKAAGVKKKYWRY